MREFTESERAEIEAFFASSGYPFRPLGWADGPSPRYLWPVDEFLSRWKVSPAVEQRMRRLNPLGVREGDTPRGFYRKHIKLKRVC